MTTHIIYEKSTGKIIQTHTQTDDLPGTREAILAHLDKGYDRARIEILLVNSSDLREDTLYEVDTKSRVLKKLDKKSAGGFGIGSIKNADSGFAINPGKVRYVPANTKEQK